MRRNGDELLTDLYELTMAAAYFKNRMFTPATFSLFVRNYPKDRAYFVNAGLEDVLDYLESFHFAEGDLSYLESTGYFTKDFLDYLGRLRFTGSVYAMSEGRLFFQDEPILEVTAPVIEAQLVESFILNRINLQVVIASKAARCVHAAGGRSLVDFSLRRTQGIDAGLRVARSSYLAGFHGTSNVLAGKKYGIPISGTMAHSYVTSFEREDDAFRAFYRTFPENTVLLIDTYDTVKGAEKAVRIADEMKASGWKLRGVRLDSGDIAELSKKVRRIFDQAGFSEVKIFASGGFDEFKIEDVLKRGGAIDAFGVGTKMGVSADAPYTDMAYKLVKYDGRPVLKLSTGKKTLVSEKQVFRKLNNGMLENDVIALREERLGGEPLLACVMREGRRESPPDPLDRIRERFLGEFDALDNSLKSLCSPASYPVLHGPELKKLQGKVVSETIDKELGES